MLKHHHRFCICRSWLERVVDSLLSARQMDRVSEHKVLHLLMGFNICQNDEINIETHDTECLLEPHDPRPRKK